MTPLSPINEAVLLAALNLFSKVSLLMTSLVGLLFTLRMVLLALKSSNSYEYGAIIGDTAKYLALTILFPVLIRLVLDITGGLAHKISFVPQTEAQSQIELFTSELFHEYVFFQVMGKIGDIVINLFCQSFYTILMALLLSVAPIMLFLSTMLGISQGVGAYFMSFISLSLWPVLWNLLGLLGKELWPLLSSSPLSVTVFWVVIQVLQVLSPVFCIVLFVSLTPSQSLSKVISIVR